MRLYWGLSLFGIGVSANTAMIIEDRGFFETFFVVGLIVVGALIISDWFEKHR